MKTLALAVALVLVSALAGSSRATAPPVGPLPKSPVTTIVTYTQELVAFALPRGQSGLVWRAAPPYSARVLRPLQDADVGNNVVLVYLAVRPGKAVVNFALTDDDKPKAYRAARYVVTVKPRP